MGEIAEMVLEGMLCERCGVFIGTGDGYARKCAACSYESTAAVKVRCRKCGKRVKESGLWQHMRDKHGVLNINGANNEQG
jgi:hypothetical protein